MGKGGKKWGVVDCLSRCSVLVVVGCYDSSQGKRVLRFF